MQENILASLKTFRSPLYGVMRASLTCLDLMGDTVWRVKGDAMREECLEPTVKHGGGNVMVWGCMAASQAEPLVLVNYTLLMVS